MVKRILNLFIIICIIINIMPVSVFANEAANQTSALKETINTDSAVIKEDKEVLSLKSTSIVNKAEVIESNNYITIIGSYCLDDDLTLTRDLYFGDWYGAATTCTLNLNGHVLNLNGHYICLNKYTTLTIEDDRETVRYFSDKDNDGCYESYSTTYTANSIMTVGGVITGGTGESAGNEYGLIFNISVGQSTTLNINGGNIVGNKLTSTTERGVAGGGIFCYGVINMNGGQISGNAVMDGVGIRQANFGGAIFCNGSAVFNLNDGVISYNTASGNDATYGGALYIEDGATVNISGGKIFNNSAKIGGAISISQGDLKITGGIITHNKAEEGGGAINMVGGNSTIEGGTITYNTALYGGVYIIHQSHL